jgi:hypothetical protein
MCWRLCHYEYLPRQRPCSFLQQLLQSLLSPIAASVRHGNRVLDYWTGRAHRTYRTYRTYRTHWAQCNRFYRSHRANRAHWCNRTDRAHWRNRTDRAHWRNRDCWGSRHYRGDRTYWSHGADRSSLFRKVNYL